MAKRHYITSGSQLHRGAGPLPAPLRQFLLQTSILERLCGPLCDVVTGGEAGQAMLERLERANLFLVSLDNSREWFRYHQLFADFLQAELRRRHPEQLVQFHRRAARWYLAHQLPEPAFQHAVAGDDAALVMQIGEHYFDIKLLSGEYTLLRAERYADSAFQGLPQEDHTFRAAIHQALGDTYRRNGRWEEARASYLNVLSLAQAPALRIRSAHVFGALADLELQKGRLRDSAAYWSRALAIIQDRATWGNSHCR